MNSIGTHRVTLETCENDGADHADLEINGRNITNSIKTKRDAAEKLAIGKVAPEIIGKDVNGKEMKLSDYRGKIVVIDFWGDW